jgi:hypothetical protein
MARKDGHWIPDEYAEPATSEMLVGDQDRDSTVEHLASMVAEGYLTPEEFSTRRDKALTARTRGYLQGLARDLPAASVTEKRYRTQVAGNAYPFSWWRWIGTVSLGVCLIVLPGPIMAAEFGGFDHAPGSGSAAIWPIIIGVLIAFFGGVAFAPDGTEPERNRKKR